MEEELFSGIDLGESVPEGIGEEQVFAYVESSEQETEEREWEILPRGKFSGKLYEPPAIERARYLRNRTREAFESEFAYFKELDETYFPHLQRQGSMNFYPKDTRMVLEELQSRYGNPLVVVNGFRSTKEGYTNAHTAGLAVDVLMTSYEEAKRLCDEAWMLGIRAIGIAGDFEVEEGFVHLDIGPGTTLNYGGRTYRGPGL